MRLVTRVSLRQGLYFPRVSRFAKTYTFGPKVLQNLLLQIDVTEIVVHEADQPNSVVDLFDAHGLNGERSAEVYFLFVNADSSAAGDESCPIVEQIGEFTDAAVRTSGRFVDRAHISGGGLRPKQGQVVHMAVTFDL